MLKAVNVFPENENHTKCNTVTTCQDEESLRYEGFVMTTSSGVLSAGGGGTDLCMAVAERLAVLDLRRAEATNDKDQRPPFLLVEMHGLAMCLHM